MPKKDLSTLVGLTNRPPVPPCDAVKNIFTEGSERIILRIIEQFPMDSDLANQLRVNPIMMSINPSFIAAVIAY